MNDLKVTALDAIADGIYRFEFTHPDGDDLPEFTSGAHVHVQVPNGQVRRYSLCNDPDEQDRYVIAVKREEEGTGGSKSLVDETKVGDHLQVSEPHNDFELKGNPARYVFIAGGIGITPIMSMIHHLQATGGKPFKLYYLTREPSQTAFLEELSGPEYRGKVVIHHDHGDPDDSFDLWPVLETPKGAHIYCCGPRGLMEAVRDMTGHWTPSSVHFEDFGTGQPASAEEDKPFTVRLHKTGEAIPVPVGVSILEALRVNGHHVPYSCESGTCGSCRTRLLEGEAEHRDLVLSEAEQQDNIMVCVSRSCSKELVIDLPE
ncbi:iron-sulfur protein [Litchfieldella qijiaojingensis]|uniref:Iron-sulfur protein n=1 Tax=Litchfieldella qijiaojingensis TaxID=980347 RepID=A0ABQ2ZBE2_9GAMM|nr:PDR/VanB family oxidoreductase [Halomonas qijiaojingensis]GGY09405.1 iron-sulfur protein [Halomonas qijiaojingensis]